ncbi:uncharacterized protein LOC112562884 isoform X2 [Pomacea canaliculata]|nr:uncharacterized protein LOC112562884 isoform X2 [Pomacea canaliculata]
MDDSKKFVCMTVVFQVPHSYPDEVPSIKIRNPRGMCEEELQSLLEDMKQMAKDKQGGPMLFEMIEMAKDCLTEGNIPHCECAICLEHFSEGDRFLKTDCYHYFHCHCLARYASAFVKKLQEEEPSIPHAVNKQDEKSLGCPMCRLPLTCDLTDLLSEPIPPEPEVTFTPTAELLNQQADMAMLYAAQKAKGGIIDLSEEKKKFLVDENTVVSLESIQKPNIHEKTTPTKKKKNQSHDHRRNPKQGPDRWHQHHQAAGLQDETLHSLQDRRTRQETVKSTEHERNSLSKASGQRNDGYHRGRYYRSANNFRPCDAHKKEGTQRHPDSGHGRSMESAIKDSQQTGQAEHVSVRLPRERQVHGYGGHHRNNRYHSQKCDSVITQNYDSSERDDKGSYQADVHHSCQSKSSDNCSEKLVQEGKQAHGDNTRSLRYKEPSFQDDGQGGGRHYHPHRDYGWAGRHRQVSERQDSRQSRGGQENRAEFRNYKREQKDNQPNKDEHTRQDEGLQTSSAPSAEYCQPRGESRYGTYLERPRGRAQGRGRGGRSVAFPYKQIRTSAHEPGAKSVESTDDDLYGKGHGTPPGFKVLGPPPGFSKKDNDILH